MKVVNTKRRMFLIKGRAVGKTEVTSVDYMKQLELPFMTNCISGTIDMGSMGMAEFYNEKLNYESIKNITGKLDAEMDKIAKQEASVDKAIKKIVDKSS